jgi:hypothetical protein
LNLIWSKKTWNEFYIDLNKFLEENKRYPKRLSNDPTEVSIARWTDKWRNNYKEYIELCKKSPDTKYDKNQMNLLGKLPHWEKFIKHEI